MTLARVGWVYWLLRLVGLCKPEDREEEQERQRERERARKRKKGNKIEGGRGQRRE